MPDRDELIASLEGRIWGGEMHKGGYIHVPQEEAEAILELLKAQQKTKTPVVFKQYDGSIESECGNCGLYLDKTYSVCPKCGKVLNWND